MNITIEIFTTDFCLSSVKKKRTFESNPLGRYCYLQFVEFIFIS